MGSFPGNLSPLLCMSLNATLVVLILGHLDVASLSQRSN